MRGTIIGVDPAKIVFLARGPDERRKAVLAHPVIVARTRLIGTRIVQVNRIRRLPGEYGLPLPEGVACIAKHADGPIEDASNELAGV
jgi:hypothetical protein